MPADSTAARKPRLLHLPAREHTKKVFTPESWTRLQARFEVSRNQGERDLTDPASIRTCLEGLGLPAMPPPRVPPEPPFEFAA